jgi:hypothetical protein
VQRYKEFFELAKISDKKLKITCLYHE